MARPPRTLLRLTLTATVLATVAACTQPGPPAPPARAVPTTSVAATRDAARPSLTPPAAVPTLTVAPVRPAPTTETTKPTGTPRRPAAKPAPNPCPTAATTVLRTTPNTKTRTVALTFDDGPGKDTPAILAILARHHIHATFFMVGRNVTAHPTWARQVAAAGHALGNHTYDHPLNPGMNRLSTSSQATQIDKTTRAIRKATGLTPCYFRAPGGNDKNPATLTLARARHMTLANWAYDPRDWAAPAYPSASYTAHIVANATGTNPHPIVLMHDGGGNRTNTVAALDRVITYYQRHGYTFTTPDGRPFPRQTVHPAPHPKPKPAPPKPTATATATATTATPTTTETLTLPPATTAPAPTP